MLQRSKPKCGSYMREVLLAQVSDFEIVRRWHAAKSGTPTPVQITRQFILCREN